MPRRRGQRDTRHRVSDPGAARQRRMNTYPGEMWLILEAAMQKKDYMKTVGDWNAGVAFLARYYKFRMDAIECRVAGALDLRDMVARGKNIKTGNILSSKYPEEGIFELTWKYEGLPDAIGGPPEPGQISPDEKIAEAYLQRNVVETREDPLDRFLREATAEKRKDNLHSFDEALKRVEGTEREAQAKECEHEWDKNKVFCLKCQKPNFDGE